MQGYHGVLLAAAKAQLNPLGKQLPHFTRMRPRRSQAEYPPHDEPEVSAHDVLEDVAKADNLVEASA